MVDLFGAMIGCLMIAFLLSPLILAIYLLKITNRK
jgi:hypothetical protein